MIRPDFVNHRLAGESRKEYRARRRSVQRAIDLHLKGRMSHVSSQAVVLPLRTVDLSVDAQIEQGKLRDVKIIALPGGKQIRVGRTKGATYRRYPRTNGVKRRTHRYHDWLARSPRALVA